MASGSRRLWASALVVLAFATGCTPGSPSPSPSPRIATATPDQIRGMTVVATIVDGEVIHCSDTRVCGGG